jgi:hypothetical protein
MIKSYANFVFLAVSIFVSLPNSHAQILVNDYSGAVTGYGFTENLSDYYAVSSPTANPTATGIAGQVDVGFYTVNYRDEPFSQTGGFSIVNAYSGDMGGWSGSGGFYTGGSYFDLQGVTGFLVSLRKEALNTASTINFYILTNQDREVYIPISTSGLSSTSFTDVAIDLSGFSGYTFVPGLQASQIGIKGSAGEGETYNFSIDRLRSVPEPSTGVLLATAIGAFALAHRRRG